jgi:hypothetical protein
MLTAAASATVAVGTATSHLTDVLSAIGLNTSTPSAPTDIPWGVLRVARAPPHFVTSTAGEDDQDGPNPALKLSTVTFHWLSEV